MPNDLTTDPFTQCYDKIWSTFEGDDGFVSLVPSGNRVKVSGTEEVPVKEEIMSADYPEVLIFPGDTIYNMRLASKQVQISKTYRIIISTGSMRAVYRAFVLEWRIIRLLYSLMDSPLSFVKRVTIEDCITSLSPQEENRSRFGWTLEIPIIMDILLPLTDMSTD